VVRDGPRGRKGLALSPGHRAEDRRLAPARRGDGAAASLPWRARGGAALHPNALERNAPRGRFKPPLVRFAKVGVGEEDPPRQIAPRGRLWTFCAAGPEAGSWSHPGLPVAAGGRGPGPCSRAVVLQFEVELTMLDQCCQRRVALEGANCSLPSAHYRYRCAVGSLNPARRRCPKSLIAGG
jgi:hypothetical protein